MSLFNFMRTKIICIFIVLIFGACGSNELEEIEKIKITDKPMERFYCNLKL